MDLRSEALKPSGGEPTGQVLNSHGISKGVAGASEEPVPDLFCAGAERTVFKKKMRPTTEGKPRVSLYDRRRQERPCGHGQEPRPIWTRILTNSVGRGMTFMAHPSSLLSTTVNVFR